MGVIRALLALAVCLAAAPASGQDVRVQVAKQRPPHYVGRPAIIQFTAEGFDQEPTPTLEVEPPGGLRTQTVVGTPRVVSGYSNLNGRISQYTKVTHKINYVVTADKAGDFTVGPFVLKQGTKEARIDAVPLSFEAVPNDPDMRIRLILPEGNVYPDQRVPVTIEWRYAGDTDAIQELSIYSPLFDQFRFAPDREPRGGDTLLPVDTKDGTIRLPSSGKRLVENGEEVVIVTAIRTLIPDRVGSFPLAPITATLERATSFQQQSRSDGFGFGSSLLSEMMGERRRPTSIAIGRALGRAQTLVVKPFPVTGRPESFAGAVGEGFSIDVAANRTVVRVGDPIGLDITLRGKGNLDNASLPPLSADGGLNPDLFRLPDGDVPGTMAEGAKEFQVSVRVSAESVAEIPALAYSWFNPETETYQTARSKPIALRVMDAQVVSASDVVSSSPGRQSSQPESPNSDQPKQVASAVAKQPVFSLSGADLAIEPLAGAVLRDSGGWTSQLPMQFTLYGTGFLLIVVALVDRRRSDVDPALVARRKNVRHQQERIARALRKSKKEAATEIAEAVRALVAEMPDVARDEAQAVIASCESIVFAPAESGASKLDEDLIERSQSVAARFKEAAAE